MTKHLWWPLDEVLYLAEHAYTVPEHRLTLAQEAGQHPTQPALIWRTDHTSHWLESNGAPGDDGLLRRLPALTWRHLHTRDNGYPVQHHPAHGFLSLRRRHLFHTPLLTQLRRARQQGMHWFGLHPDPAADATDSRFLFTMHRGDILPPHPVWVPAWVSSAVVGDSSYRALVADPYTVRGDDVLARFDRPAVEQMITDLNGVCDARRGLGSTLSAPVLRLDHGVLRLFSTGASHPPLLGEIDRILPDADGHFTAGAYRWPWLRADK